MAKGVALPINTVIILVLAGIVLIALVAMFIGRMFSSEQGMDYEKAWSTCCVRYCHAVTETSGYNPDEFECDYAGDTTTLEDLATSKTSDLTRAGVLRACGCLT